VRDRQQRGTREASTSTADNVFDISVASALPFAQLRGEHRVGCLWMRKTRHMGKSQICPCHAHTHTHNVPGSQLRVCTCACACVFAHAYAALVTMMLMMVVVNSQ
jgi:hypothetical protein